MLKNLRKTIKFHQLTIAYDIDTGIKYQAFKKDYDKFIEKIEYLDLRLASIINQGFDDCGSLEAILKVNVADIISSTIKQCVHYILWVQMACD